MLNKIIYAILGFGFAFVFFPHRSSEQPINPSISGVSTIKTEESNIFSSPEQVTTQVAPQVTAKSALVIDLDSSSVLYSKNIDEELPVASLTKLMTALVVVQKKSLDDVITIDHNDKDIVGVSIGLSTGEQLTVLDLLKAMLIPSSNDAALVLAKHVAGGSDQFALLMNEEAKRLGLHATYFSNPVGWDSDQNYSNALDLIKIVKEFNQNEILKEIVKTKETTITSKDGMHLHQLNTTNKLLLENSAVVGIKTGFTSKALGNLITEFHYNNRKIVSIVLGSTNREEDSRQLLKWVLEAYRW